MSLSRTPTIQPQHRLVARKEIPTMPTNALIRFLDASASVAVVCLALYLGFATTVLGV